MPFGRGVAERTKELRTVYAVMRCFAVRFSHPTAYWILLINGVLYVAKTVKDTLFASL